MSEFYPQLRTVDGDHSVSVPASFAMGLTDQTWTSVFPDGALDRAGVWQPNWYSDANTVLSIPSAWRAGSLVAGSVGSMNLGAFRGLRPLPTPSVLAEPNLGEGRENTVANWMLDLLLHGNAFGVLSDRDSRGYVSSVVPTPPTNVSVVRKNGRIRYLVGPPEIPPDLRAEYGRDEVFHARGYGPSGSLRGQGVLERHLRAVETALAGSEYVRRSFRAGVPAGIIKLQEPMADAAKAKEKAAALKTAWMETFGGLNREPAVLSAGIDFTPLSWSPSDLQLGVARDMSDRDMARIFGVAAYWVDAPPAESSQTYQNIQDASIAFARFSLEWWVTVLETEFSRLLPRGTDARFNRDNILRPSLKERTEIYDLATGHRPWLTVEEVRADKSLMPLSEAEQLAVGGPPTDEPVSPLPGVAADQQSNAQAQ